MMGASRRDDLLKGGANIDQSIDPIGVFGRHFVALAFAYHAKTPPGQPREPIRALAWSGFILDVLETSFFMTAGHCVRELGDLLDERKIKAANFCLWDHFGHDAKFKNQAIYIPFEVSTTLYVDENGFDFAAVPLTENTRQLLEANGILVVAEKNWKGNRDPDGQLFVLGLIDELQAEIIKGNEMNVKINLANIPLETVEANNERLNVDGVPEIVGRVPNTGQFDSIKGMSGGPIFALSATNPGQYSIIGMQTRWNKQTRLVYGCPIRVFGELIEREVKFRQSTQS